MIPEAVLSHATPGRSRLKVPSRKGDKAYFSSLKEFFSGFEGVSVVQANALTGSVLLLHSGELKSVAEFAEEKALFKLRRLKPAAKSLSRDVANAFSDFDGRVKRLTSNELDVPGIAFVTLLGFGIYEIARGNYAAPAWYTVFWYALNIFLKALPEPVQEENTQ